MSANPARRNVHLDEVYPLLDYTPVRGEGVFLEDEAGRRVLDLYGGHAVAALGYQHPVLSTAIQQQARALLFQSNALPMKVRDHAAQKLADFAPAGLERVFFVNSGAEANENALRLAIRSTGRPKIVALEHAFHGRSAAAAAVTWNAKSWYGFPRTPFDVTFIARDDPAALINAVDAQTAALILEPVQGLAGAYDLSQEFVATARKVCDSEQALLIFDEVQTGMGRLGHPFGADMFAVQPDMLTTAKGLAGGLPAGALLMHADIAEDLRGGDLGTTFGGGPVACAAIVAVIDSIEHEDLLSNVREVSAQIRASCALGPVVGFQGAGFLLGLKTKPRAAQVRDALLDKNILTGTSTDPHVLRLLPPLILSKEHVQRLAAALGALSDATI